MSNFCLNLKSEDDIFERLLALDFYRDLVLDNIEDLSMIQKRIKWHKPLKKITSYIPDIETYHSSFFPLFMIESLQMLSRAKYSDISMPNDVEPISCRMSGVFVLVLFSIPDTMPSCSVGDIVFLYITESSVNCIKREFGDQTKKRHLPDTNHDSEAETPPLDHPMYSDTLNHAIGYVESSYKNRLLIRLLILPPKFATMETFNDRDIDRLYAMQQKLQIIMLKSGSSDMKLTNPDAEYRTRDEWHMSRLVSFTTPLREFRGLCMLQNMPLKQFLLRMHSETSISVKNDDTQPIKDLSIPKDLKNVLESTYNFGQLRAISNSARSFGITLIQGPPGTGKTTTIIGIISVILQLDDYHNYKPRNNTCNINFNLKAEDFLLKYPWFHESDVWKSDTEVDFEEFSTTQNHISFNHSFDIYDCLKESKKQASDRVVIPKDRFNGRRILICAPSNAAIDEIVKRLVRTESGGIFGANGCRYNPKVIRVGPNIHDELKEYSLERNVEKWLAKKNNKDLIGNVSGSLNKSNIKAEIIMNSDIVCSTLSACGSNELFGCLNCFDTLIVDEATQAVELSTLVALSLGCKRAILVGDPCQLSATVCSKVAIELNYDQSLFQRLQLCNYPVNLLNTQYRMVPQISSFPSMYFYQNRLKNASCLQSIPKDDWSEFPLFRSTVFYALDSQEARNETSYINEMEVELVCQLLEIIVGMLSKVPGITATEITQKLAVISPYSAQVELLKANILKRIKIVPILQPNLEMTDQSELTRVPQIDISTVDGFQGMEKEIVIFSAVRTNYVGNRRALNARIEDLLSESILTIDNEPHHPEKLQKFAKVTGDYLENMKKGKIPRLNKDIVDVSFIADRRRINVAITRACRNLFIVGNPRYLLDHTHWHALYNHYARCGLIFFCRTGNGPLAHDYLKQWAINFLKKAPDKRKQFLKNPYLRDFVVDLMK